MAKELLGTYDASLRLGVSPEMVRYLERTGKLPARRTAGGVRIFLAEDVERLAAERETRSASTAAEN